MTVLATDKDRFKKKTALCVGLVQDPKEAIGRVQVTQTTVAHDTYMYHYWHDRY